MISHQIESTVLNAKASSGVEAAATKRRHYEASIPVNYSRRCDALGEIPFQSFRREPNVSSQRNQNLKYDHQFCRHWCKRRHAFCFLTKEAIRSKSEPALTMRKLVQTVTLSVMRSIRPNTERRGAAYGDLQTDERTSSPASKLATRPPGNQPKKQAGQRAPEKQGVSVRKANCVSWAFRRMRPEAMRAQASHLDP